MARRNKSYVFDGMFRAIKGKVGASGLDILYLAHNVFFYDKRLFVRPGYARADTGTSPLTAAGSIIQSAHSFHFAGAKSYIVLQSNAATPLLYLWQPNAAAPNAIAATFGSMGSGDTRACFAQCGDTYVAVCGGGTTYKLTCTSGGTAALAAAGITAPSSNIPTLAVNTAITDTVAGATEVLMTGVFSYRYSFYDTATGFESVASPPSLSKLFTTNVADLNIDSFDAIPATANRYRIYRRREGSAYVPQSDGTNLGNGVDAEDDWALADEIRDATLANGLSVSAVAGLNLTLSGGDAVTDAYIGYSIQITAGTGVNQVRKITAWTSGRVATISSGWDAAPDGTSVVSLGYRDWQTYEELGAEIAPLNNYPPSSIPSDSAWKPHFVVYHKNRAFYMRSDSLTVRYSELPNPSSGLTGAFYVGDGSYFILPAAQSEKITGGRSFGGVLVLFTAKSVFVVDTDNLETGFANIRRIEGGAGCAGHWTIAELPPRSETPGRLLWANEFGVQYFNGGETNDISTSQLIDTWNTNTTPVSLAAASAFINPDLSLYILSVNTSGTYRNFVFNMNSNIWSTWGTISAKSWFNGVEDAATGRRAMFFCNNTAFIQRLGDFVTAAHDDGGSAIAWSVQTNLLQFGDGSARKKLEDIRVVCEMAHTMNLTSVMATSVSGALSKTLVFTAADMASVHYGAWGGQFVWVLSGSKSSAATSPSIIGVTMDFEERDLR